MRAVSNAAARRRRSLADHASASLKTVGQQISALKPSIVFDPKSNYIHILFFFLFFVLYCSIIYLVSPPPPHQCPQASSTPPIQFTQPFSAPLPTARRLLPSVSCPPRLLASNPPLISSLTFLMVSQAIENMGFNQIPRTQAGVLSFIGRDFASATFAVASDAGENCRDWRFLSPPPQL